MISHAHFQSKWMRCYWPLTPHVLLTVSLLPTVFSVSYTYHITSNTHLKVSNFGNAWFSSSRARVATNKNSTLNLAWPKQQTTLSLTSTDHPSLLKVNTVEPVHLWPFYSPPLPNLSRSTYIQPIRASIPNTWLTSLNRNSTNNIGSLAFQPIALGSREFIRARARAERPVPKHLMWADPGK